MSGQPAPREGFRWECPYCGGSRLNVSKDESGKIHAIAALRTHIMAMDGTEHGPKNEFPADFETLDLAEYVVRVDGGDDSDDR